MDRREFCKTLLQTSALAAWPGFVLAAQAKSDQDVLFIEAPHADYNAYRALFNKNIDHKPRLIAVCFNEQGVIKGLAEADKRGLPVSIKSGGHSFEGYSVVPDSLVIDLTNMNSHQLSTDGRLVTDPATRLMQLYEDLVPKGRLLPTGSCGMVGIAGLTLGGGYGIFAREYGLTCDYLKRARLVDAQGKVHEVEAGSDLFWACQGGGNGHFGVVTRLEFDTVAAPTHLWRHVFKAYKLDAARAITLMEHWFDISRRLPDSCFAAFVLNHRTLTLLVTNTAVTPDAVVQGLLSELEKLTDKRYSDKRVELTKEVKRYYGILTPLYFKNASAGFYEGYADIKPMMPEVINKVINTRSVIFQVNTLGGAIKRRDVTATAYAHRNANYLAEVQSYWNKPEQADTAIQAVQHIQSTLWHGGVRAHYANYPDSWFPDWAHAYYGEKNLARLQQIKRKYDPGNRFRYAQSIQPA
ncbi:MAG: FAD-binding oxidoreductase [Gammaproteobacteria bacterium]|nr:FAD-binding oxidoreductase [Gammaproteobacteria bacterium]MDH5650935.1 FAD-binding oxidoreductase [Gammaproteobacteria bacterium]